MKYLKKFNEELSSAEKTAISNFPHKAKEDAEKREKRIKKSQKEDPDGMYPRDDERYDDTDSEGGWQDGMGKPSWLGENSNLNEMVNEFTQKAAIERLEQVSYTFRDNPNIVEKIQELISMIESYN